jgi:hypothetical protein
MDWEGKAVSGDENSESDSLRARPCLNHDHPCNQASSAFCRNHSQAVMPALTLPPSFTNSFWSQDYRRGLETLFDKLEQVGHRALCLGM